ncbi:universal stress protein [Desertivirga arenae]|uniref:universal stress protein n=1 Tax=Desertivirga arenae TaxID=2810309 RepID=UPI001A95A708|nr:universal stress protein [Pedobacter sp. SYSU D00823]
MKRIIAAFDGLKYAESTEQYAVYLAQETGASLTGVFLEDFTHRSYHLWDMVENDAISPNKVKELLEQDKITRLNAVKRFEEACNQARIETCVHRDRSIALQELLKESIYADLLVISAQETLTHFQEDKPSQFISFLLADVQCPVLIVPEVFERPEEIVLLYDGNPSSVYAARMFSYLLPELKKVAIEVLSVESDKEVSKMQEPELMKEFIDTHFPGARIQVLRGDPETEIVSYLEDRVHTLAILGAYKRNMVSRWFRASMANILMEETNLPLFIAHYK